MDLFVGSIPFKLKENQLKELFEKYGEVTSAKIVINKMTRQSAGYAFVVMPNDDQARAAIEGVNGLEIDGRTIVVNKSVPKEENPIEKERKRNKAGFKPDANRSGGKKPFKKEDGRKSNFKSNKGKGSF